MVSNFSFTFFPLKVVDTAGKIWTQRLHGEWNAASWSDLQGRVADLKAAYKQLPRSPAHRGFTYIAVKDPSDQQIKLFETKSMMFGETAAVYGFLRFSRAIAALGTKLFGLCIVEFFDDFTQLEPAASSASSMAAMEGLITLLGWQLSMSEEKRKGFAHVFVSLGIEVDLTESGNKQIILRNKAGRIEGIKKQVDKLLASEIGFKDALSLNGRFRFAEGQLFGRVAAPVLFLLSAWATSGRREKASEELRVGLLWLIDIFLTGGPRIVGPRRLARPILVFTDGACEPAGTSVGGVVFFPGGGVEFFGSMIPKTLVSEWASKVGQTQVIGQAELFPLIVARLTWQKRFVGQRVMFFIDNESARLVAIKGYSPVLASLKIVRDCLEFDYKNNCSAWNARVPTVCNPGDDPSRMRKDALVERYGAVGVRPIFPGNVQPDWYL